MKKLTPLALSLSLLFAVPAAEADSSAFSRSVGVDEGQAIGLDMMLLNSSLLRNGDNVWTRVREGFQMTEVNPGLVERHERQFASKPEYFKRSLDRSRKYLFHIMNEVERRGMPTEIALLPVVESAFVATAQSPVGASGLWQFMPATGRHYGLEQTWWYDGRRDVVESTRAALDYLEYLNSLFGDWSLALAAYNWGEGNVSRAIARAQAAGQVASYENLRMPAETRNYVPKLLAVRNLLATPDKYGLKLDRFPNKPYFVSVSTGRHMDIDVAAKLADMPVSEFKSLNPGFNLPVYAHKNGRQMLIPADKLSRFEKNLDRWNKPLLTWQVVTPGGDDTVESVAGRYGMDSSELVAVNNLRGGSLSAGRPLLVAKRGGDDGAAMADTDSAPMTSTVTTANASRGNAPENADLTRATVVVASAAPAPKAVPTKPVAAATPAHVEAAVETAASVNTTPAIVVAQAAPLEKPAAPTPALAAPAAANSALAAYLAEGAADTIRPTTVALTTPPAADAPVLVAKAEAATVASVVKPEPAKAVIAVANPTASRYTVAQGDTLYNISRRYKLSVTELMALNGLGEDSTVKLGQQLKVKGAPTLLASAAKPVNAQDEAVSHTAGLKSSERQPTAQTVSAEYVVQKGDTVFSIARKFGVRHSDIQRWNDSDMLVRLSPGQRVRVQGL
ncbi:lytic transglycosylase [Crenobacter cavernae]|uniref:LysM peptidoglycan-binding domain-containing protein n=1 Tax=Crenobacter cavernae TaxID=2290923 RepID=A0A345Y9W9_9NEIS|nr:LysM peptidoglycan-binding domain-containing protein [Crenobacter cavernae]AXK40721.1 LysM peptidoglycan-binding domain-containing protein [Crenobacter cavernae]